MKFLVLLIAFFTFGVVAMAAPQKGFSPKEMSWMAQQNNSQSKKDFKAMALEGKSFFGLDADEYVLPYGEYENQGYILFNDESDFGSRLAKRGFLSHLPDSIIPVIFTTNQSPEYVQSLKERWGVYLNDFSKLKIMALKSKGNSFWARDGIPVPTFKFTKKKSEFTVVDAIYYHDFEADYQVAKHFSAAVSKHDYYFEGGNFMPNAHGDCLVVNTDATAQVPDSVFSLQYGCKNLIRLPYLKGIGHADESVKFVDAQTVITDAEDYAQILKEEGFEVVMMPRPKRPYETYMNSVFLEKTVYVPVFGREEKDKEAMDVYRSLGFTPVPLNSYSLSNEGLGSLHCISMVYPKVSFKELLTETDSREL